ncbi:hypothetical protein EYF80_048332 [Liparis tanakae]|uniref:Uncharacterized protein n=1 Tax=Liparis tanakae TaxID=230148 RepID=A0A4Z2FL81_9TELE|nr:hypothetical protein EYF80_048332 [Liparis tanakae]
MDTMLCSTRTPTVGSSRPLEERSALEKNPRRVPDEGLSTGALSLGELDPSVLSMINLRGSADQTAGPDRKDKNGKDQKIKSSPCVT